MSHSHKKYCVLYEVYVNEKLLGFVIGKSELGAMQNATKLFGFETTENFIDCYPGKFDPQSFYTDDEDSISKIVGHNMTIDYYLKLPRVEQVKISYFNFHRINKCYTVIHDIIVMHDLNSLYNIAIPILYPLIEDVKSVVNFSELPNKCLWFCCDWKEVDIGEES